MPGTCFYRLRYPTGSMLPRIHSMPIDLQHNPGICCTQNLTNSFSYLYSLLSFLAVIILTIISMISAERIAINGLSFRISRMFSIIFPPFPFRHYSTLTQNYCLSIHLDKHKLHNQPIYLLSVYL